MVLTAWVVWEERRGGLGGSDLEGQVWELQVTKEKTLNVCGGHRSQAKHYLPGNNQQNKSKQPQVAPQEV